MTFCATLFNIDSVYGTCSCKEVIYFQKVACFILFLHSYKSFYKVIIVDISDEGVKRLGLECDHVCKY